MAAKFGPCKLSMIVVEKNSTIMLKCFPVVELTTLIVSHNVLNRLAYLPIITGLLLQGAEMSIPIHATGLEESGVTLFSPASEEFENALRDFEAGRSSNLSQLRPFLVFVENRTSKTIVAYTVGWTLFFENGSQRTRLTQFKYPDALLGDDTAVRPGRGEEMLPGERRLVTMEFQIGPWIFDPSWRDWIVSGAAALHEEAKSVSRVDVALDAVVFEDGRIVGPDKSDLARHFTLFVRAKQNLYQDVMTALARGESLDNAIEPARQRTAYSRSGAPAGELDTAEDLYARIAAEDLVALRRAWSASEVEATVRHLVRSRSFDVHR